MRPQISREGARGPAHARRKRADVSSAALRWPAATCGSAALASGCRSAVSARLPRERAPGSPRGPESVLASSGRAGPTSPEGQQREVSPATPPWAPLPPAARPAPLPRPPRGRSHLPLAALPSISAPQGRIARLAPVRGPRVAPGGGRARMPQHLRRQAGLAEASRPPRGAVVAHASRAPLAGRRHPRALAPPLRASPLSAAPSSLTPHPSPLLLRLPAPRLP